MASTLCVYATCVHSVSAKVKLECGQKVLLRMEFGDTVGDLWLLGQQVQFS